MKYLLGILSFLVVLLVSPLQAQAANVPIGFHLLDPFELSLAETYRLSDEPLYVTVPWSIYDRRRNVWENFFREAQAANVRPIIRWVTEFKDGVWTIPSRKDIVEAAHFMSSLSGLNERIVVLFNEPNHAVEWGGEVNPEDYAELALFAAQWLKTEPVSYIVLPAGLDADAPNAETTMESFRYIDKMYETEPQLFEVIDAWTSHSYPNPGFSGSAYDTGKNSLRGYEWELTHLEQLSGRDFDVYITETGWKSGGKSTWTLNRNYAQFVKMLEDNPRIKAVTVFLLRGSNGPFEEFSLLDSENQPTAQLKALEKALDGN